MPQGVWGARQNSDRLSAHRMSSAAVACGPVPGRRDRQAAQQAEVQGVRPQASSSSCAAPAMRVTSAVEAGIPSGSEVSPVAGGEDDVVAVAALVGDPVGGVRELDLRALPSAR
ncbi:hypothetical protein DI272_10935 [Streptomyces sp. Act143]|nr:hypothetical protein DI272_10935 [Streptomyces sp. Act143]